MNDSSTLTPHERSVRDFYDDNVDRFLKMRRSLERNWGLWSAGAVSAEQAGRHMIERALDLAAPTPLDAILDVGCGFGVSSLAALERVPQGRVLGIDLSDAMIEAARRAAAGREAIEFEVRSATALDLPDESLDRVLAIDCACHFETREVFFRQAHRALRPGGRLVVLDICESGSSTDPTITKMKRALIKHWRLPEQNRYPLSEYRERVQACGFTTASVTSIGAEVFPGAFAFYLAPGYRALFREVCGTTTEFVWAQLMAWIQVLYEQSEVDYVQVVADK